RHLIWYLLLFIVSLWLQLGLPAELSRFTPFCLALPIIALAWHYSNQLTATGTNFFLTRWQYASQGYNTLSDVLDSYRHDGNRLW
ncbi:hypothetical protein ONQ60_25620, partial [Salmonella enterica subsp. enterica serovar Virginia]|nr:hypothetical protein [Salmonella enterica subsp. enterica serovar Virginia]